MVDAEAGGDDQMGCAGSRGERLVSAVELADHLGRIDD